MKKSTKVLGVLAILVASTLVVSAGLLSFYGKVETTANVEQSVVLWDGSEWVNYNTPIGEDFDTTGGSCECVEHSIKNRADVEAPIEMDTNINGHGKGPGGVNVSYYLDSWMEDASLYNQIDNVYDETEDLDEPYFEYTFKANGDIQIDFYNPTTWLVTFDYRVDMEPGEDHEWTNDTIGQGPCAGDLFGQKYNWVELEGGENDSVTVSPCYKLDIGHRVGAEQNAYIPWVTIERPELTSPFTLQPGEQLDFIIQYCFDIAIEGGAYDITTTFAPVTDR